LVEATAPNLSGRKIKEGIPFLKGEKIKESRKFGCNFVVLVSEDE
jgi:hypothetical protein